MGIKIDLLPPARYESGFLNWAAQNFTRIQVAVQNVAAQVVSPNVPSSGLAGDLWLNTSAKTLEVHDGTEYQKLNSYDNLTFNPLWLQPGTIGRTVVEANYQYDGDYIVGDVALSATGVGNNNTAQRVSWPVTPANIQGQCCGHGYYYEGTARCPIQPIISGSSFLIGDAANAVAVSMGQTGSASGLAIPIGGFITFHFRYRWA